MGIPAQPHGVRMLGTIAAVRVICESHLQAGCGCPRPFYHTTCILAKQRQIGTWHNNTSQMMSDEAQMCWMTQASYKPNAFEIMWATCSEAYAYLKGVSPGLRCLVTSSNCLPFRATNSANLIATFSTSGSVGARGPEGAGQEAQRSGQQTRV